MKQSAGILLYKFIEDEMLVLLAHPGGPFWKNKDLGAWSIPKGEIDIGENPLDAAKREFEEETGTALNGDFIELTPVKLKSGKAVLAWAVEGELDIDSIKSNMFELEWPPKSGVKIQVPEIDRAQWFTTEVALKKVNEAQADLVRQLVKIKNR